MRNFNTGPLTRVCLVAALGLGATACEAGAPKPRESIVIYLTPLMENLAKGRCNNVVVIWGEEHRKEAQEFVEGSGHPTPACPTPQIDIVVACDPAIATGTMLGESHVIRYRPQEASVRGCPVT